MLSLYFLHPALPVPVRRIDSWRDCVLIQEHRARFLNLSRLCPPVDSPQLTLDSFPSPFALCLSLAKPQHTHRLQHTPLAIKL
jgi:hypothetical protein